MTPKTLTKLQSICSEHDCDMDAIYDAYWQEWNLIFFAPEKMQWNAADSTAVVWNGSLKGAISFLKSELECGFREADELQLEWTGQSA
jgi:hypothetical protein